MHKIPACHPTKANSFCNILWGRSESASTDYALTFDGLLRAGLEPGQGADLGLPDEAVRVAEAELLHHQVHGGADLRRVRVAAVHHLQIRIRFVLYTQCRGLEQVHRWHHSTIVIFLRKVVKIDQ